MVDKTFFTRMKTREEVEAWLASMERLLAEFMAQIPPELHEKLDGTTASFDHLEAWLLSLYSDLKEAYNPEGIALFDAAGRYVGEVIRKRTGAEWYVELDQLNAAFLGFPVLKKSTTNSSGKVYEDYAYPLSHTTACIDRRTGVFIRTVAEKYIVRTDADTPTKQAELMKRIQDELSAVPGIKFLGFQEIAPELLRFEHENRPRFYLDEHPDKPGVTYAGWIEWFTEQLKSQQVGGHNYFMATRENVLARVFLDDSYQWVEALFKTGKRSFGFWLEDLSLAFSYGMYCESMGIQVVKRDAVKWRGPDFEPGAQDGRRLVIKDE